MKARSLVLFGIGYVVGTRAGRERWEQITALRGRLADLLDEQVNGGADEREPSWSSNGDALSSTSSR